MIKGTIPIWAAIIVLWIVLTITVSAQNVFPTTLNWQKVKVVESNGEVVVVDSEYQFLQLTKVKNLTYQKGDLTKSFNCPVDALFWIFKSELSTNSHFGDKNLKDLYRSKIKQLKP